MPTIQELREQRNAKAREARNLVENNEGDKWTPEMGAKVDELLAEVHRLDDDIARYQKVLDATADDAVQNTVTEAVNRFQRDNSGKDVNPATAPAAALFAKWLRKGDNALSAEEWQQVNNALSTGTGSEGGYTVQTDVAKFILEAMKEYGGMREVATVIHTAQGNPMSWPTSDGTSEIGEIVDENASATDSDVSFGTMALSVYKFSSKAIAVPIELLQDSSVDIEAFVRRRIAERLWRITNRMFTVGTGTNQPKGIVTASASGRIGVSGQTSSVTYEDLIDLEHSVDPAYRRLGCGWMFHDNTLRELKKLKDAQGRPIWLPDVIGGAPAAILGYGYTVNQDVPTMTANAKSILFGKLSAYVIRDAMEMVFHRFTDSAYAKKGQVGFLAFSRSGGNLLDVGGAVKHYQNAAS
ncbi:phage major capsid protein [Oleidesulfovibrio sp.]|uniref:phage major capsid protein n=1 Tax=Oleidesulfovibrio sp. TaxID=2909707 RepID=UPI003A86749A